MAKKDFYEVLGVSKTATEAEIKSAFRRLARQHHPDVDKSEGSAERFKEVSEAYQVLSDPQKRRTYDQFGSAAFESGGAGAGGAGGPFGGGYNPFGGGGFSYSWSTGQDGGGQENFMDPFDLFEQIFGGGFRRRQTFQMQLTFEEAVHGVTKEVEIERIEGNQNTRVREKMKVKVPAGVDEGTRMRFNDVDIIFRVKQHSEFIREGADIYTEASLSVPQAVLGDTLDIKTVHGKVKLKVPPGSQPGSLIRVKGKGVPTLKGETGDHYVRVKVQIPKNVTGKEKDMYEELAGLRTKKKGWF